jgi:hypothetical protein
VDSGGEYQVRESSGQARAGGISLANGPPHSALRPPSVRRLLTNVNPPSRPLLSGYEDTKAWSERRVQVPLLVADASGAARLDLPLPAP